MRNTTTFDDASGSFEDCPDGANRIFSCPAEAKSLSRFLETWIDNISRDWAGEFHTGGEALYQELNVVLADLSFELADQARQRMESVRGAVRNWSLCCQDEPESVAEAGQAVEYHAHGLIGWLNDLQVEEDHTVKGEGSLEQSNVQVDRFPRVVLQLKILTDPCGLTCGSEHLSMPRCTDGVRALGALRKALPQPMTLEALIHGARLINPGTDALKHQLYKLRRELEKSGGCWQELSKLFYSEKGFWSFHASPKESAINPKQTDLHQR